MARQRKTGRAPIAMQAGNVAAGGAIFVDPAGRPYSLSPVDALEALGGGDVRGPAGAVIDNALTRWDGTTGRLLQGGDVTEEDDGRLANVTDPVDAQDAATKQYVDDQIATVTSGGVLLTADPGSPADDTWWVRRTGSSPTMDVEVRVRIGGTTYTIAGITI